MVGLLDGWITGGRTAGTGTNAETRRIAENRRDEEDAKRTKALTAIVIRPLADIVFGEEPLLESRRRGFGRLTPAGTAA